MRIALALLPIAACFVPDVATLPRPTDDGRPRYHTACDGADDCIKAAESYCPKGYVVEHSGGKDEVAIESEGSGSSTRLGGTTFSNSSSSSRARSVRRVFMIFSCREG